MDLNVIRYATADGVAVITLNRPDRLNAWTNRMEAEYRWCLEAADADTDVRVIVVTGEGRGFCAGADMAALGTYAAGEEYDLTAVEAVVPADDGRPDWAGSFSYALGLAKPVIAAVNGPAAGVGFVLMCFADIRFAAAGAKLTTSFARLGLPAEHGVSWMLPRLIGAGRAADMLYSSRVVLAEEAKAMGLVSEVYPADELLPATLAYARAMAAECAPTSLLTMKRQLWGDLLGSLEGSWRGAVDAMTTMIASEEFKEGLAAFEAKRPPAFPGIAHPAP
ncbi:MAG: enoyl-CoA hydratase-related protein [Acidimicrobiales bacterium]